MENEEDENWKKYLVESLAHVEISGTCSNCSMRKEQVNKSDEAGVALFGATHLILIVLAGLQGWADK